MQAHALFYRYSADESRPPDASRTCNLSVRSLERSVLNRISHALLFAGLIFLPFVSASAGASEILVALESLPAMPASGRIANWEPGTRFGVALTAPVDGTIVGVQIMWGSVNGDATPSQEAAIHISSVLEPNLEVPVTTLATINSPVLIDGGANVFRYLDPGTNLTPLSVPVSAGTDFFVDLEIANFIGGGLSDPTLLMGILPDDNGMGPGEANTGRGFMGRNSALMAGRPKWFPWFTLGYSGGGNMGIRVIIQPVPEPSTYALAAIGAVALFVVRRKLPLSLN
jgi:hypothetical protein